MKGLEPSNGGTTNHCLNHLATLAIVLNHYNIEYRNFESPIGFDATQLNKGLIRLSHWINTCVGLVLISVGGMMVVTNPGQVAYEKYATDQMTTYLKEDVCMQIEGKGDFIGVVRSQCKNLVDTGQPQLQKVITQTTKRQNFLLFSIYQTELSLPSPVPSYQFETIGVLQNFYTYQVMEM